MSTTLLMGLTPMAFSLLASQSGEGATLIPETVTPE